MGISRREFRQRHTAPPVHLSLKGAFKRTLRKVALEHAGSTITASAGVVAVGGALLALGLVETSGLSAAHPHAPASPLDNDWVVAGLAVVLLGAALAIGNLVYLFLSQLAKERWIAHLAQLTRDGQLMLDNLQTVNTVTVKEIGEWYTVVRDDLTDDDPTGSLVVRWHQGGGAELNSDASREKFLTAKTEQLTQFLAELR